MPRDDELAQTATAPGPGETVASDSGPPRVLTQTRLGRFELEAVLGAGGMGTVHAAFDPELERRVAVKVLHAKNPDARARLLREARAMAKLSHANVITVFDVGTADGEDFVAMELVEGGTLLDWLDSAKPRPRDAIAAFVAAGRGLEAAHVEGLVHRDFKPANVLRSKSGRIVVTDFGLARSGGSEASRSSIDLRAEVPALTATGSLLGTPGYMAPEQWRFEAITPATDQFAFCVALWEALAGERPFRGTTLDELKTNVLAGPSGLDDNKLPRELRPLLRRGLAVDPAKRWPSMTELLEAIERATSRRPIAILAGAGVLAAGVLVFAVTRSAAPGCVQPAIDPDSVALTPGAKPFVEAWRTARASACDAKREVRVARLACLDAVFARIADAFHERTPGPDALAEELVDPAVCDADQPPHMVSTIDAPLSAAFAVLARAKDSWKAIDSELTGAKQPPCVRTVALFARRVGLDPAYDPSKISAAIELIGQLQSAAAACDDEGIKAQAAFAAYTGEQDTLRRVEQAAKQFPSDANLASLAAAQADTAVDAGRIDEGLATYEAVRARHAAAGRRQAELDTVLEMMKVRLDRSTPGDLDAVLALAEQHRGRAREAGRGAAVAALEARARWRLGQVEEANRIARDAAGAYSGAPWADAQWPALDITGTVVDAQGKPVANAQVVAAAKIWGDDVELSSPVAAMATTVETTSRADGTFALIGARKAAMARLGDQASLPTPLSPGMTLRLGPTSTVEGDVALGGEPFTRVRVAIFIYGDNVAQLHAGPLDPTGHFKLSGIPRGNQQIAAMFLDDDSDTAQDLDVTQPALTGIHVRLHVTKRSTNPLSIIGRSETENTPDSAMAFILPGAHPEAKGTLRDILRIAHGDSIVLGQRDPSQLAPAFQGHLQPDDLTGELLTRADETVTICALGLSKKLLASVTTSDKVDSILGSGDVGCVIVPSSEPLAIVPIPAVKRR